MFFLANRVFAFIDYYMVLFAILNFNGVQLEILGTLGRIFTWMILYSMILFQTKKNYTYDKQICILYEYEIKAQLSVALRLMH